MKMISEQPLIFILRHMIKFQIPVDAAIEKSRKAQVVHLAAKSSTDSEHLQKIFDAGASLLAIDGQGYTAFHYACMAGNMVTFTWLFDQV